MVILNIYRVLWELFLIDFNSLEKKVNFIVIFMFIIIINRNMFGIIY